MRLFLLKCFSLFFVFSISCYADDTASSLFEKNAPMVFQIKVIDKASGNKAILGSGFQVTTSGVIATNYHVISEYLLDKNKYTIEVLDHNSRSIKSSIISFDIVHDLALLQASDLAEQALKLSQQALTHGNRIYSMGNPNDLGMTIIEGTYNGLVEASRYNRYLFSGSLNSGMSGGPVFNASGEVIGINVSKGGEQISFLVPVKHLHELMSHGYEPLDPEQYNTHAHNYLLNDQDAYYTRLINSEWQTRSFEKYELPDKIDDSLKCWGHTADGTNMLYSEFHRHCKTDDQIYINHSFYTGLFNFSYRSITSSDLNSLQFYKLLETKYPMNHFSNNHDKKDTTGIVCETGFVDLGGKPETHGSSWKVTTCAREYIHYESLYDVGLVAMYVDSGNDEHNALLITMNTSGISKENIKKLHSKFMAAVKWNH